MGMKVKVEVGIQVGGFFFLDIFHWGNIGFNII